MPLKDEISYAIASHSIWKTKLRNAIETGMLEIPLDTLKRDDECVFGKWLIGETITPAIRNSERYNRVKELHAKFHIATAQVAELVIDGDKTGAQNMMDDVNGEYTVITSKLVMELSAWMKEAS